MTQAAQLAGCTVYHIPGDFKVCGNAENALWHVPAQSTGTTAIWVGFIPSAERYSAIYHEALRKRIKLVNNPDQHLLAQEFDRAYPLLPGLTPESISLSTPEEYPAAAQILGYPIFVRGAVRSRKAAGWSACVASTEEELKRIVEEFFKSEYRSRGRVILRKLVRLRHSRYSPGGFPLGREYRVFLLNERVVGHGYYWEGADPLKKLSKAEEAEVLQLAQRAAHRLKVPFIAIDVGQQEDESWTVIEVNDAQFAGTSQIPALPLWNAILDSKDDR